MKLGAICVLSAWITLVDFLLQRVVCFGMGEKAEEEARKRAGDRV